MNNLLEIRNLKTVFNTFAGQVSALNSISLDINYGEAVGIVGESGSGKSVTMLSIMRLLSDNGKVTEGTISFDGKDLRKVSEGEMEKLRGNQIGMIFQDPMTSLNPVFTIGNQLIEAIRRHNKISRAEAFKRAIEVLNLVGIPQPDRRMKQYPHEFSGGMRQRAMIAMALSCEPKLLIADEPTTALDVTIQAQIMELMKDLKEKINMAIILITHDLGLVADVCDKVVVMYGGTIVEKVSISDIFYHPEHPYTMGLLKSIPRLNMGKNRLNPIEGQPPDMSRPQLGCPFVDRCPDAMQICTQQKPAFKLVEEEHGAACWLMDKNA